MPVKDRLTKWHQYITIFGVPMGLAIAGWFAVNFDNMRLDIVQMKTALGFVQEDISRHTTELDAIQKTLAKRP